MHRKVRLLQDALCSTFDGTESFGTMCRDVCLLQDALRSTFHDAKSRYRQASSCVHQDHALSISDNLTEFLVHKWQCSPTNFPS